MRSFRLTACAVAALAAAPLLAQSTTGSSRADQPKRHGSSTTTAPDRTAPSRDDASTPSTTGAGTAASPTDPNTATSTAPGQTAPDAATPGDADAGKSTTAPQTGPR